MPALRLHVTLDDGGERVVEPWRWRDGDRQLRWGQLWSLALASEPSGRCAAIEGFVRHEAARLCPRRIRSVRAERVWLDVDPAAAGAVVRQRELCRFAFAAGQEPVQCGSGATP